MRLRPNIWMLLRLLWSVFWFSITVAFSAWLVSLFGVPLLAAVLANFAGVAVIVYRARAPILRFVLEGDYGEMPETDLSWVMPSAVVAGPVFLVLLISGRVVFGLLWWGGSHVAALAGLGSPSDPLPMNLFVGGASIVVAAFGTWKAVRAAASSA